MAFKFSVKELKEFGIDVQALKKRARVRIRELELLREINYRNYQKFTKARRHSGQWIGGEKDRKRFEFMQRNLYNLDNRLNTLRAASGLRPKKYSYNPYPEED